MNNNISCRGFGMVELVMVMLLLSITAASFASSFNFSPSYLKHAEEKLMADVRYAKSLAMTRGGYYGVYFEPTQNRYTVFQDTITNPIKDPADRSQNLVVDFDDDPNCRGVDLSSALFSSGEILLFDAQGTPKDSYGWQIYSDGQIVIANDTGVTTLLVSPETGKIRVQ